MKQIIILPILILLVSCGGNKNTLNVVYSLEDTTIPTEAIRFEARGGGQISFIIKKDTSNFLVNVSSVNHKDVEDTYPLDSLSGNEKRTLNSIFNGTVNLGGTIYSSNLPTGHWKDVHVLDKNQAWIRVANSEIISNLQSIYTLIYDNYNN